MIHGNAGSRGNVGGIRGDTELRKSVEDITSDRVRQTGGGEGESGGTERMRETRDRRYTHVRNSFRERLLLYTVHSGGQKGPHMATRGLMYVIRRITL